MKIKTINTVIIKKFNEWLNTISDESVKKLVKENTIITGGCITSMLLQEDVNDFDVYFSDKQTTKKVAEYYVKQFNETNNTDGWVLDGEELNKTQAGAEGGFVASSNISPERIKIVFSSQGVVKENTPDEELDIQEEAFSSDDTTSTNPKYRPIFLSPNAITLSNKIQIVIRFYGNPEEIHDNYDFIHCTNYWTSKEGKVVTNLKALEAILAKELVYIGSKYPIASLIRTRKFIKRNWTINAGQYLKMAFQVSLLDLTNIEVLEDQLVGVDSAYFGMLISALKEQSIKNPEKINYNYISEIVDRIF